MRGAGLGSGRNDRFELPRDVGFLGAILWLVLRLVVVHTQRLYGTWAPSVRCGHQVVSTPYPAGSMYAGDVTPEEAFQALVDDDHAVLVDVRTHPELVYVGFPDLAGIGKRLVVVEWQSYPQGQQNPHFVNDLRNSGVDESKTVYFLCRSGARSRAAAILATAAGYESAFNVGAGFEGGVDEQGHRGKRSGWKAAGLPWRQG